MQSVTVRASRGLSDANIVRMVQTAEQTREADNKKKDDNKKKARRSLSGRMEPIP